MLSKSLVLRASRSSLRSEEHTSELQSQPNLVCRLLLEKKNRHKPGAGVRTRESGIGIRTAEMDVPGLTIMRTPGLGRSVGSRRPCRETSPPTPPPPCDE